MDTRRLVKFKVGDDEKQGELVDFTPMSENWSEYEIPELKVKVRIRPVIKKVLRMEGTDPCGQPILQCFWDVAMDVQPS